MDGQLYSVTVKYELHHSVGETVPTVDEVREAVEKAVNIGHELHVHTERSIGEPEDERLQIEGCRVVVDEIEVQEARRR